MKVRVLYRCTFLNNLSCRGELKANVIHRSLLEPCNSHLTIVFNRSKLDESLLPGGQLPFLVIRLAAN